MHKVDHGVHCIEFPNHDTSNILSSDCVMGMAHGITLLDSTAASLSNLSKRSRNHQNPGHHLHVEQKIQRCPMVKRNKWLHGKTTEKVYRSYQVLSGDFSIQMYMDILK